jgi:sugar-specific transcriptional regulator TrmB/DNA-binding CsgD family transcriptional regulator
VLTALGVDPGEERVYGALVGRPSATVATLSRELGLTPTELVRSLELLEARGLVARSGGQRDRYVAAPPAVALGALLNQRRDELRRAETVLTALARRYRQAAEGRSVADLIEVVSGEAGIRQRFDQLQRGAEREILAFWVPVALVVSHQENLAEADALRRGVRYRVVLERALLDTPGAADEAHGAVLAGEELRVVDRVPLRLTIADRALALVPLADMPLGEAAGDDAGDGPSAVLVHRSGMLDALVALFEAVWVTGQPLLAGASDPAAEDPRAAPLDELDQRILSLLLVGLTDRSVAGQLGLSMRTVQRRVRYLMDRAGVQTRLQLGWHAAQHGWV